MRSNYNQEVNHVPLFVNIKRFLRFAIAYNFFGILNYIIFTAIVVKSQMFLGLSIVCRSLNHLLKFLTLVILLALYSLGALLTVINVNYFYELRELDCD